MGLFKKSKNKGAAAGKASAAASRAAAGMDSDSDLSMMSEDSDWEADRAALQQALSGAAPGASLPSAAGRAAAGSDPFEEATLWADVDPDDLERIALNIARNAVPPAADGGSEESAEAAARLNISAAVAEQAEAYDSTDPLGYGRIDTRLLTLSRDLGAGSAGAKARYSRLLEPGFRRGPAGRGRGEDAGGSVQAEAPLALRAKVLPGSEQFDAAAYLGTLHADKSLPELLRGLNALRQQLSEHTGQLKSLVKENFDRFTSSKNTIDTVYAKLQKGEVEGESGVHGSSTREVLESVLQVQDEAKRAFGPLLERQAKADRIRLVLGVMQRYEAVVQLPSRVRQHAEAGDYDQVAADYRKAKALLADQGGTAGGSAGTAAAAAAAAGGSGTAGQQEGSMWAKLMVEIDKVVGSVAHSLEAAVRSVQSGPGEALDAVKFILQLKGVGVPAAQGMDPVGLYVSSQERHVRAMLESALAQHTAALEALRRAQRESEEQESQDASLASLGVLPPSSSRYGSTAGAAGSLGGAGSPAASGPPSAADTPRHGASSGSSQLAAATEAEAVRYISSITLSLCQWLPDFWALTQYRLPALAGSGDAAAAVERGMAAAGRSVALLLSLYRSAVQSVLANPAASELGHAGLLSIASELASGCQLLQAPAGGTAGGFAGGGGGASAAAAAVGVSHPGALQCLQHLAESAIQSSLDQLSMYLQEALGQLCAGESYRLTAASRRAGQPSSASVAALQQLVQQGMQHLQAVLGEAGRAGVDPKSKAAAAARAAFFGCFSAFAAEVDAQADCLVEGHGHHGGGAGGGGGNSHHPSLAAEAAAASALASSNSSGGGRGSEAVAVSPARRLLVLCANLGAARSRLLPQQFARWSALLQAGGSSSKELQAAAQACAAELEAAETRLASAYIDRKQIVLDEIMEQLLFTDGTSWEAALPPTGLLRPVVMELLHAVVATQAELSATAPALLLEALEELLIGTLDGFTQVLSQGLPTASAGGVLQVWLEGTVLLSAVGSLGSEALQQSMRHLRGQLDERLDVAVAEAGGEEAAQLAAWVAEGGGAGAEAAGGGVSAEACRRRLSQLCKQAQAAARCNLAPLQGLAAPRQ